MNKIKKYLAKLLVKNKNTRAIGWLLLEKSLRLLSGILITAAVARHLGPDHYGVYSIILGTVAIFGAGASMGADHINVSEISKQKDGSLIRYLSSAITIRLIWSLLLFLFFLAFIFISKNEALELYTIASTLILLSALSIIGNSIQAIGSFESYVKLSIITMIVSGILKLTGIIYDMPTSFFLSVTVFDSLFISFIFSWWIFQKYKPNFKELFPSWDVMHNYFRLCFPTAVSAILVALYLRTELFVINHLMGVQDAGLWAAAMMLITPWGMVSSAILPVANKHLAKMEIENNDSYNIKIIRLLRYMLFGALLAIFINLLLASTFIPIVLGAEYAKITEFLWISSFALIPLFMGSVQEIWIAHQKTTSIVLKKVIIGLPLSSLLLYILVNNYGLVGAAFAMIISYITTAILINYWYDRKFLKLQLAALGIQHVR